MPGLNHKVLKKQHVTANNLQSQGQENNGNPAL